MWEVLDEDEPPTAAEVANGFPELRANLRFDAQLLMGQMRITYHTSWIAQVLPISSERYLLVGKFIPQNVMIGFMELGVAWFIHWRSQFLQMAANLPAEGEGCFCCCDYGNWGTVAYEVLGLDVF